METLNQTLEAIQSWASVIGPIALAIGLMMACFIAWMTNLVTLPGNWIMAFLVGIYAWLSRDLTGNESPRLAIGLGSVVLVFVLALAGEAIEFLASAAGAKKAGASRKSTFYAIIGSMVGALVGAVIGIPIPVLGPIFAAIIFGGLGATGGAMFGEWTDGRGWRESWSIGHAAFWGRTFGTLGKVTAGLTMLAWVAISLCF